MPIFEFKCAKCEAFMEVLVMGSRDEQVPMRCKECGSEELERVISATNISVAAGGGSVQSAPSTTQRTCSSGSCTTWNLPGHSR